MKIEVVTLHYIYNYGSLLQTYATQKKFESMGHKVEIVDYVRPNAKDEKLIDDTVKNKNFGNPIKNKIFATLKRFEKKKIKKVSKDFLDNYVHLTRHYEDYEDLKNNPPIADVYCTGSDQTWNSEYNGGLLPAYYLDFAPKGKKKIGYAVSIGMDAIPENEKEQFVKYVNQYDYITVREDSAKQLINNLGYDKVTQILDPTLVLNKNDWKPMIADRMIKEKYIIIYRLNDNPEMEAYAKELSEKTGCKIVRMSYYLNHFRCQGKMIYTPKVEEFLSLINYADYVITDSFHCTAFSLNFHKEFFIFYPGKYSTRLQSILELTGTTHRVMNENKDVQPIDFDYVDKVLNKEREKVDKFITDYCN